MITAKMRTWRSSAKVCSVLSFICSKPTVIVGVVDLVDNCKDKDLAELCKNPGGPKIREKGITDPSNNAVSRPPSAAAQQRRGQHPYRQTQLQTHPAAMPRGR
jgi:hypothetical protein